MFIFSGFADEIDPMIDHQIPVLKDLGIRYIELRGVDGTNISMLSEEETIQLKHRLDRAGIKVSAIGSPLGKISIKDDFTDHLALFDHVVKQAQILETSYIRLFSFYDAAEEDRSEVLRRMQLFIDHTPDGIILLHENEKGIYGNTARRCLDLLSTLNSPKLLATYDPANFIQEHQETQEAFDMLAPFIAYMHIKDAVMEDGHVVPPGQGDAHFKELIEKLRQINYHGFLSLEPHLADFAGYQALEQEADASEKADASHGGRMFRLAYNSLLSFLLQEEIQ